MGDTERKNDGNNVEATLERMKHPTPSSSSSSSSPIGFVSTREWPAFLRPFPVNYYQFLSQVFLPIASFDFPSWFQFQAAGLELGYSVACLQEKSARFDAFKPDSPLSFKPENYFKNIAGKSKFSSFQ